MLKTLQVWYIAKGVGAGWRDGLAFISQLNMSLYSIAVISGTDHFTNTGNPSIGNGITFRRGDAGRQSKHQLVIVATGQLTAQAFGCGNLPQCATSRQFINI